MDITTLIVSSREQAMLEGGYSAYRTQLAGRLRNCRKRLNIATKSRAKYHAQPQLTPEAVAENKEYLHLQIMTAERAWAHAMTMKSAHAADNKGITGSTRSHIVSRLHKAARTVEQLAEVLGGEGSGANQTDVLEARAYAALLRGAEQLEKHSWEECLRSYSIARIIYSALASESKKDTFKDLLSETIDPSIRYAAYQLKSPRSLTIPTIARKAFPKDDEDLISIIQSVNREALEDTEGDAKMGATSPTTITFRSREVRIEDAAIATAWLALQDAKATLAEKLSAGSLSPKEMAAAYDDVLAASQDSVDATKQAIDELKADGVTQGDSRMQSLAVTRTAVNYEMISWRIGRNRVLSGERDGAVVQKHTHSNKRRKPNDGEAERPKPEPVGRQLARLKEKTVLYDGIMQSLESIKELPGVAADDELSARLNATSSYFEALKCLAIGRSHAIVGNLVNSLALIKHALEQAQVAVSTLGKPSGSANAPSLRNIDVSPQDVQSLGELLEGEVQRYRALVDIDNMRKEGKITATDDRLQPLADKLSRYPARDVDLQNIVAYPPALGVIPMKPIFLDLAFNYIEYPDDGKKSTAGAGEKPTDKSSQQSEQKQQKRGWFGFGR
uniref:Signal recognition particle subunit SRP68 n=1 Tax=Pyricularia oryzae (strain P131) TaxID=1143193 RepID=L7ISY1_PYRO1